ncbi:MAG: macro domain-containing protein [Gemmataceae bacterium]
MSANVIARLGFAGGRAFEAVEADLLRERVDAIVNAANGALAHGGGVAAAIARAAGEALTAEDNRILAERGHIPTGDAVVSAAGKLPFKGIIHAVGPVQGQGDEEGQLTSALLAAFRLADDRGWQSLAFPAVSSGIFGVPVDVCARAYIRAVREFFAERPEGNLKAIRLCLLQGPIVEAVRKAVKA